MLFLFILTSLWWLLSLVSEGKNNVRSTQDYLEERGDVILKILDKKSQLSLDGHAGMACTHVVEDGCNGWPNKITPNVWLKETLRLICFVLLLVNNIPPLIILFGAKTESYFQLDALTPHSHKHKPEKNWQDLLNRHNLLVSYQLTFRHRSGSTQRSPQASPSTGSANLVAVNCAAAPFLTRCWLSSCVEIRDCYGVRLLCQDLFGSHKVSLKSGTGKETKMGAVYPSLTHFWML